MNHSITSTLPRTWHDINWSLGSHHRLQLVTVYKNIFFGVKTITPPPPLSSFHWMKVKTKLICLMYFNLWNISKKESFSSCTRHKATGDISLRLCMTKKIMTCYETRLQGPWQVFQWFVLPPKFFADLAVTFFGFAAVLSTCCCARHVKKDHRVFQLFVLQHDKW